MRKETRCRTRNRMTDNKPLSGNSRPLAAMHFSLSSSDRKKFALFLNKIEYKLLSRGATRSRATERADRKVASQNRSRGWDSLYIHVNRVPEAKWFTNQETPKSWQYQG